MEYCTKHLKLLCEYKIDPIGLDTSSPRFTWQISNCKRGTKQKTYKIIVASSKKNIEEKHGDMWDTEKITDSRSFNIPYMGETLQSGRTYFWIVHIWDEDGKKYCSETATFCMGILDKKDWKAKWITAPQLNKGNAPLFRKEFNVKKDILDAKVFISGLGYFEMYLNGRKVGDSVLDPGWTDYTKRVLYCTYDVSEYLEYGKNTVGIMVGNGWFDTTTMFDTLKYVLGTHHVYLEEFDGCPQLIFQLDIEYENGLKEQVLSGKEHEWFVSKGPICSNNIFHGETYDARMEKNGWDVSGYDLGSDWRKAQVANAPGGKIVSQIMDPIKVTKDITPISVTNPEVGIYVFDMGQNISGWIKMKTRGTKSDKIVLKYAEILYENGKVNQENLRRATATDTYILKGSGEEVYEPRFTYHGFRFVQIEGYPGIPSIEDITGRHVRNDLERIGDFSCSNELLNKIYQSIMWTEMNNQHSIPTDCPQRDERQGWLNDMTARAGGAILSFDMANFYEKWVNDIEDTQDDTGAITDTAPFIFGHRPADPVCSCFILIPWLLYVHYGDIRVLQKHYESMKRWVEYLGSKTEDFILYYSNWGDWVPPIKDSIGMNTTRPSDTPGDLVSTAFFYFDSVLMSKIARVLKHEEDEFMFLTLSSNIREAFNNNYFDTEKGFYGSGSQGSNVIPLAFGMAAKESEEKVFQCILDDLAIRDNGKITTGNQSTRYILDVLTDRDQLDTAYSIVDTEEYPSWGYMLSKGASTMWERWEYYSNGGMNSHDHPMLGSISHWFYQGLGGIYLNEDTPAFEKVDIKPGIVNDLQYVDCTLKTIKGELSCKWKIEDSVLKMNLIIPFNCSAKVFCPDMIKGKLVRKIKEGDMVLYEKNSESLFDKTKELEIDINENGTIECIISGGEYAFIFEF